jgi:hypothetical protein
MNLDLVTVDGEIVDGRTVRAERYALQSAARQILPKERVARCLRFPVPNGQVEVWRHQKTQKSFYAGLGVCGSVWNCPVCASKISERRRKELESVITQHRANGGFVSMLTLTVRHTYQDDLQTLLERLTKAMTRFRTGKRYNNLRQKIGLVGTIRAFELTHGKNGWHPHFHILLLYEIRDDEYFMLSEFMKLWKLACEASGLESSPKGMSLQDADDAAYYASKWGIDSEMTKSHAKRGGAEKGRTPFDILRDYLVEPNPTDRRLFQTFATCFKGKQQLVWSRGLKAQFNLQDLDDEAIAKQKEEPADLLGMVPWQVWRLATTKRDLRETLLSLTEDMPFDLAIEEVIRLTTNGLN